ncbi:hypothetical protein B0H16DRAFT_1559563 [Mycena metata]|uniref:Secreted protein n=1 Tax=Mycena metata TaxID=1033252 RepID=A0AAD7IL04_9AGAR|nr:hypothetical protein B0H16DRAFT_1559563 [Mycena metata]
MSLAALLPLFPSSSALSFTGFLKSFPSNPASLKASKCLDGLQGNPQVPTSAMRRHSSLSAFQPQDKVLQSYPQVLQSYPLVLQAASCHGASKHARSWCTVPGPSLL